MNFVPPKEFPQELHQEFGKCASELFLERFKFRQFSRCLPTVLAIASEIDTFCQLKNRETLSRLWALLGGFVPEADDVYKLRYQAMVS